MSAIPDFQSGNGSVTITPISLGASSGVGSSPGSTGTTDLGKGNNSITLAGDGNVVTGGNGADTITGGDSGNSITLGNGMDNVSLTGGNNMVTLGNGPDTVSVGGGGNSISLGDGADTVQDGSGDTITLTGNGHLALYGMNEMVFLAGSNASIDDLSQGMTLALSGQLGDVVLTDFAKDPMGVIDLMGGLGGFTTPQDVLPALHSDGHGGTLLSLGGSSSLDFANMAPAQLTANHFAIG